MWIKNGMNSECEKFSPQEWEKFPDTAWGNKTMEQFLGHLTVAATTYRLY